MQLTRPGRGAGHCGWSAFTDRGKELGPCRMFGGTRKAQSRADWTSALAGYRTSYVATWGRSICHSESRKVNASAQRRHLSLRFISGCRCWNLLAPLVFPHSISSLPQPAMANVLQGGDGMMGGGAGGFPLEQWFYEMPVCTRWWMTAALSASVLVQCHIISPFQLFYSVRTVFFKSQVSSSPCLLIAARTQVQ